ncbi:hypothetical protein IM792_07805 [Mucilaginibacter sp. JRF]|uniref:hypothetical protein n=1 Tax=Mucilaginibacter sp. JRF TaxID=2780088 RepID=UPI00187E369D|nr:hypothetical protein [Mucilaginibacter sp. JRF]MBE9584347.1 hypothetical protein [Mucilaginibacter sp. JRF]
MKLEFLNDVSDGGKFPQVVTDQLIRLYDFDSLQADALRQEITSVIIQRGEDLKLSQLKFIEHFNCDLTLHLSDTDTGIIAVDEADFICDLTKGGYENMVNLLEPFCVEAEAGHQWLYEIDTPIDFLFSPDGTW